jgi:peptidoglycan/xylan/chitin deacetylase (PgdA/CDA1 family)
MNRNPRLALLCFFGLSGIPGLTGPSAAFAGPVTTVPWNGHTGAVSFTYDDARTSQLPILIPQLDSLKVKATFFIASTGTGGDFEQKKPEWLKVAQRGHELANHTRNHVNVPADPDAAAIISDMAKYMRGLDPSIEAVTFAYPNCNVNGKSGVGAESFMARGCGDTRYAWNTQPSDWMNLPALLLTPTSESNGVSSLNSAKSANTWAPMLSHDVKANPDQYSITPQTNLKLLQTALANGLWIDTYAAVGAYYRAHFAMDAATATANADGWSLAWTSPHPKMPKKVILRVKLAAETFGSAFTVQQGGVTIAPESDGAYLIDFMKLSLTVLKKTTGVRSGAWLPGSLKAQATPRGIEFDGVVGTAEALVADVHGRRLFQGEVTGRLIPLPRDRMEGVLFLTLIDRLTGKSVRARVAAAP